MRPSPAQVQTVITAILAREGGFSNDVADKGGATQFGITQSKADEMGLGDVKNLTQATASTAYARMFAEWRIDQIPDFHTFALMADSSVNNGPVNAARWLQNAIGAVPANGKADGVIGPQTIAKFASVASWPAAFGAILAQRFQFYGKIVTAHPDQSKFAWGWMNRATEFISPWPVWEST